jgi:hypothetical protein
MNPEPQPAPLTAENAPVPQVDTSLPPVVPVTEQAATEQPLQVTNAAALRQARVDREHGELVKLDSGNVFRLSRPNLSSLVSSGAIPSALAQSAINVDRQNSNDTDLKNYVDLQRLITKLVMVQPKVVEADPNYDANELLITDLTDEDITEIYMYAQGGMEVLSKFREDRQRAIARLSVPPVSSTEA